MHKINISKSAIESARERRAGRLHAFENIDTSKTALLVIDMQKYFMEPGMAAEVPMARVIVPNINRLASKLRETGGQVAWVVTTFSDDILEDWPTLKDLFSSERCQAMIDNLAADAPGHEIWPDLEVAEGDWIIEKNRFSALIGGASDLEEKLRASGIDHVIISGTLTDVCCESTARDAMMLGFKTTMITDANASRSDDDHNNALSALVRIFADVVSTDDMIDRLK